MVIAEVSGSIIVRDKSILMVNDGDGNWSVPLGQSQKGELGSDTARRIAEDLTGCSSHVIKYKKKLKTDFTRDGDRLKWQPYTVEIDGEPSRGEWIPVSRLGSKQLASPLNQVKDKLSDRL